MAGAAATSAEAAPGRGAPMLRLNHLLAAGCEAWHRRLSPRLPPACRFTPSCSLYAAEALRRHGLARGLALAVRRLARCRPGQAGGPDPVP